MTTTIRPSRQFGRDGFAYTVGPEGAPHTTGWAETLGFAQARAAAASELAIALRLRDRADSYSRDAQVLHDDGDTTMAVAFRAIARELRACAATLDEHGGVPTPGEQSPTAARPIGGGPRQPPA